MANSALIAGLSMLGSSRTDMPRDKWMSSCNMLSKIAGDRCGQLLRALGILVTLLGDFRGVLFQRGAGEKLRGEVGVVLALGQKCLGQLTVVAGELDAQRSLDAVECSVLRVACGDCGVHAGL